jgi:cardiolipin synthase (CMP-forming)
VELDPSTASAGDESRILTVPNVISFVRLATVPVFVWLFVSGYENAAVILYAAGAWSDFFDGWIARRTDSVTALGKLLDPLADRIFIAALVIALVVRRTLPWWVAVVILGRDLLVLSLFPYLERRKIQRIVVNRLGKTATAALLTGLTLLAVSETTVPGARFTDEPGLVLTLLGAALYWAAAYLYAREAIAKLRALGERTS